MIFQKTDPLTRPWCNCLVSGSFSCYGRLIVDFNVVFIWPRKRQLTPSTVRCNLLAEIASKIKAPNILIDKWGFYNKLS